MNGKQFAFSAWLRGFRPQWKYNYNPDDCGCAACRMYRACS